MSLAVDFRRYLHFNSLFRWFEDIRDGYDVWFLFCCEFARMAASGADCGLSFVRCLGLTPGHFL